MCRPLADVLNVCLTVVREHILDVDGRGVFGVAVHKSLIFFIQCECHWIKVYKASSVTGYNFLGRIKVPGMTNPTDLLVFDGCLYVPDDMTSRTRNSGDHCVWKIQLSRAMTPGSPPEEYSMKMLTSLGSWWPLSLSRTTDGRRIIITATTKRVYFWNPKARNGIDIDVVALPPEVPCTQHVIELPSSMYLLCHPHRVCRLVREDNRMKLVESPPVASSTETPDVDENYLNNPRHLAQLPDGKILVVDHLHNRVLLMAQDLNSYTELLGIKNGGKKRPCRIVYDKDSGLLAVAFHHHVGLYSLRVGAPA